MKFKINILIRAESEGKENIKIPSITMKTKNAKEITNTIEVKKGEQKIN